MTLAASLNRIAVLQYLYAKGADLDRLDKSDNTPLMWAVRNWQFDAIKLLEFLGCDIGTQD